MSDISSSHTHVRILVVGRANAGKTTLLKRVCNATEDPCLYDEKNKTLLEPNSGRGISDIDRPFSFRSNPKFIFHDAPGFEAGDARQLAKVQSFINERAQATDVNERLHAIWFCFLPDISRFLFDLEKKFFNEQHPGNVPVIAVFTKFDDLINQVYDFDLDEDKNREVAEAELKRLQAPLFTYKFPPKAGVQMEGLHNDDGNHQEQVKVLLEKTAECLDDPALKLFVSA